MIYKTCPFLQTPCSDSFQDCRTNWVHCSLSDREAMQNSVQNRNIWSCPREQLLQSWEKQQNNSNLVVTENISARKISFDTERLLQTNDTKQIDIPNINIHWNKAEVFVQPNTGVFDRSDSDKAGTIQVRFTLLRKQVTLCHTNWTACKSIYLLGSRIRS